MDPRRVITYLYSFVQVKIYGNKNMSFGYYDNDRNVIYLAVNKHESRRHSKSFYCPSETQHHVFEAV